MIKTIELSFELKREIQSTELSLWDIPKEERTLEEFIRKTPTVSIDLGALPGDLPEGFDTERFLQYDTERFLQYARHGATISSPDVAIRTERRRTEITPEVLSEMETFLEQLDRLSGLSQTTETIEQDEF